MADSNPTTVIGKDTTIKGEFQFDGSAKILGALEGAITAKGTLEIGDGGRCKGTITGEKVVIDGRVEGDVTARTTLQLAPKGTLQGDLVAQSLVIAEGASLVGHCRVGPDALKESGSHSGGHGSSNSTGQMAEPKPARAVAASAR